MTQDRIPAELRRQVRADAGHRCGYCLSDEALTGVPLTFDHLIPRSAGGLTTGENLWLACRPCNEYKGTQTHAQDSQTGEMVPLFNPRQQAWQEHMAWSADSTRVVGLTPTGCTTVAALKLNRPLLVYSRKRWVAAGWQPPRE
jgi:hypothetical protein